MEALLIFGAGCAASLVAIRAAMALAWRLDLLDRPAPNKIHTRPVPRIGGLGIAAGILAAGALLLAWNREPQPHLHLLALLLGAVAVTVVGLLDDILCLRPSSKLAGVALAAALPIAGGLGPASPAAALAAWAFVIFTSNAMNLLDGLDGLASSVALIAASTFLIVFWMSGMGAFAYFMLALIAALVGFLWYNLPPARTFMGDTGSLLIGYLLGWSGVVLADSSVRGALAAVLVLGVPIADVVFVVCRRIRRRQSITVGALDHAYYIIARSIRQAGVLRLYCLAAGLLGMLALISSGKSSTTGLLALALVTSGVCLVLALGNPISEERCEKA